MGIFAIFFSSIRFLLYKLFGDDPEDRIEKLEATVKRMKCDKNNKVFKKILFFIWPMK
jgi:hypothetical protein